MHQQQKQRIIGIPNKHPTIISAKFKLVIPTSALASTATGSDKLEIDEFVLFDVLRF